MDSETLAGLLKQHDIYVTASQNGPCSNALAEALSSACRRCTCSTEATRVRRIRRLGFRAPEEFPGVLERLVASYEAFQRSIWVDGIDELAQSTSTPCAWRESWTEVGVRSRGHDDARVHPSQIVA